jgi:hypothetical protein
MSTPTPNSLAGRVTRAEGNDRSVEGAVAHVRVDAAVDGPVEYVFAANSEPRKSEAKIVQLLLG